MEIVRKNFDLSIDLDAIAIMMNPGDSAPVNDPVVHINDVNELKTAEESLVVTNPDRTQSRIMSIMNCMGWNHVRVINLSDLREKDNNQLENKINYFETSLGEIHSIFSASRQEELDKFLIREDVPLEVIFFTKEDIMIIVTPLGNIDVLFDGVPVECKVSKLKPLDVLCPDVAGRYKLKVEYIPDGKEHLISCRLIPILPIKAYSESGENLECYGYYNSNESIKVSIGIEADTGYVYEKGQLVRANETYDYDGDFKEENAEFYNSYHILPNTKTTHYVFGIAWILECNEKKDVQTWFGADPAIM